MRCAASSMMLSGKFVEIVDFANAVQDLRTSKNMSVLASAIVAAPLNVVKSICEMSCDVFPEDLNLAVWAVA